MSQRLDGMAAGTIERVQRNMETTRTEAVDRFVSRLRDQLAPMLVEAKDSLQKLETPSRIQEGIRGDLCGA